MIGFYIFFCLLHFCNVAEVVITHKKILARFGYKWNMEVKEKSRIFTIYIYIILLAAYWNLRLNFFLTYYLKNLKKSLSYEFSIFEFARKKKKKTSDCNNSLDCHTKNKKKELPDFHNRSQQVAKYIKWILILFLFSYLVYSQVWLNLLVGDLQFG